MAEDLAKTSSTLQPEQRVSGGLDRVPIDTLRRDLQEASQRLNMNYTTGNPAPVLYIQNLAKDESQLKWGMEAAATIDNRGFKLDEEEVAETLYALAGMFPHNASNHNSIILDGKSLPANSSVLQDLEDNSSDALEGCFCDWVH
ncbi:hypothetical protein JHK87_016276 [Glycine soja]|nr:hypothetical protein JHK87_016276 [Glycine soja]